MKPFTLGELSPQLIKQHHFDPMQIRLSPSQVTRDVTGLLLMLCLLLVPMADAAMPGTLVAWGAADYGKRNFPAGLSGVTAIAAGRNTVALKNDGTVVVWGEDNYGMVSLAVSFSGVSAIAAGSEHAVALKNDGTVVAWGRNTYGQTDVPSLVGVMAIAAGGIHSVALRSNGTVVAWGYSGNGRTTAPVGLSSVKAIAAGDDHTVALKSDGTVVAWGLNNSGQTTIPADLSGVAAIAGGKYHTVALKTDGTVVAWGGNDYQQATVPAGLSGVTAIAAGYEHTVALKSDGSVVVWGNNRSGQTTGTSTTAFPFIATANPVTLDGVAVSGATAIAAGDDHTVVIGGLRPNITTQPVSLSVNVGQNPSFTEVVTGTAPLSYQWRKDGVDVLGASSATLTLSNVQTNQAGNYVVVITNAFGSVTSSVASLTVNRLTQTISFGSLPNKRVDDVPFTLSATASSGLPVSYVSLNAGVATVAGNTVMIAGVGTATITARQAGDARYLSAADVSRTLTVAAIPPVITTQPLGVSI